MHNAGKRKRFAAIGRRFETLVFQERKLSCTTKSRRSLSGIFYRKVRRFLDKTVILLANKSECCNVPVGKLTFYYTSHGMALKRQNQ